MPRRTVWIPPRTISSRYAACRAPVAGDLTTAVNPPVPVFHRSTESYDSVDRELLGEVLTRSGVPTEVLVIIRNFHEGVHAR